MSSIHVKQAGRVFRVEGTLAHVHGQASSPRRPIRSSWTWLGSELVARTDTYGIYPIYYWCGKDEIALSTSLVPLLLQGAPADLDEDAIAVFMRFVVFIGDRTPFAAIKRLPPGATLTWSSGGLALTTDPYVPRATTLSRDQAVDAYIELFDAGVRKLAPRGPLALPLSGGRDSRHVLYAALRAGLAPACLTVRHIPPRPDEDVRVASLVTRELGLPHLVVDQPCITVEREVEKYVVTNFESHQHTTFDPMVRLINRRFVTVCDGLGGDYLSGGAAHDAAKAALAARRDIDGLAHHLLAHFTRLGREPAIRSLLGREGTKRFGYERAFAELRAELERHIDAPNPLGSLYFWNRARRSMAQVPCCMYAPHIDMRFPYLDPDVFELLMSLPTRYVSDRRFHDDAIRRGYPQYAHIPFEDDAAPPQEVAFATVARRALALARLAASPGRTIVDRRFLLPRLLARMLGVRGFDWLPEQLALYLMLLEDLPARAPALAAAYLAPA